jgi:hypothetical protein
MSAKGLKKSVYKAPPSVTGTGGDNNTSVQSNRNKHVNTVPTKRRGKSK